MSEFNNISNEKIGLIANLAIKESLTLIVSRLRNPDSHKKHRVQHCDSELNQVHVTDTFKWMRQRFHPAIIAQGQGFRVGG